MMIRICLITAAVLLVGTFAVIVTHPAMAEPSAASKGVAIVELFTSEGCSSCPPADDLLNDLSRSAAEQHLPVYALAFHVDYWNSLGWADPFSSAAFTARQATYVQKMKLDSNYTPQMIVNGATEFVGSDRNRADAAIHSALAAPLAGSLTTELSADSTTHGSTLKIHTASIPAGSVINVAIVEDGLQTKVERGENAGRTLHHEHVVRWFKSTALPPMSNDISVAVPELSEIRRDRASLIVYVQREDSWQVIGATALPFNKSASR